MLHRYYGETLPTPDFTTPNMQYLSAHQALADIMVFRSVPEAAGAVVVVAAAAIAGMVVDVVAVGHGGSECGEGVCR